jgi:hypothetical protein
MTESASATSPNNAKSNAAKIGGLLSMVLWVVGFILLFALKGSPLIWLSDTLLLLGFWPLLFVWKPGWTWVIFGWLNIFISFMLELTKQITPEMMSNRLPPHLMTTFLEGQKHLGESHGFMPWFFIGIFSVIFGTFRVTRTIYRFAKKQIAKGTDAKQEATGGS